MLDLEWEGYLDFKEFLTCVKYLWDNKSVKSS